MRSPVRLSALDRVFKRRVTSVTRVKQIFKNFCLSRAEKLVTVLVVFVSTPILIHGHGALDERIKAINLEIARDTNNAQLFVQRAECHREHRDWTAASEDYDRAEKLDGSLTRLDFFRARLLSEQGLNSKARGLLDHYLGANTNDAEALVFRARLLSKLGEGQGAVADFSRAIELSSEPQPELFLERAELLTTAGRVTDALSGLDEGIKKLGAAVVLQTRALDLELAQTNYDGALVRVGKIVETSPRKESWLVRRGEILLQAGRGEESRKAFADALSAMDALPARLQSSAAMIELSDRVRERLRELDAVQLVKPVPAR